MRTRLFALPIVVMAIMVMALGVGPAEAQKKGKGEGKKAGEPAEPPITREDLKKFATKEDLENLRSELLGEIGKLREEVKDGFKAQGDEIAALRGDVQSLITEQKKGRKETKLLRGEVKALTTLTTDMKKEVERHGKELNGKYAELFIALLADKKKSEVEIRVIRDEPRYSYVSAAPCYDRYPSCGYACCCPSRAAVIAPYCTPSRASVVSPTYTYAPTYYAPTYNVTPTYYYYPSNGYYYSYYQNYWYYWNTTSSQWYPYRYGYPYCSLPDNQWWRRGFYGTL